MTENQRDEILLTLVDKLNENIEFTKSIDIRLKDNIKFTKAINNAVVVIEVEHGNKLSALFDGYTANSEKLDKIQNDIKIMNSILTKHDNELYLLKSN